MNDRWIIAVSGVLVIGLSGAGCGSGDSNPPPRNDTAGSCATERLPVGTAGATGSALVFQPDPLARSGSQSVSPTSAILDELRSEVTLDRLGGQGVLEGSYVDIRNGTSCREDFGAFDSSNRFQYNHSDPRFQEAMSYFYGDTYRASLDSAGYLLPKNAVKIVAHCMQDDNAYFVRGTDENGQMVEKVCLGDSVMTPGASYSDDASVVVHELQHATTVDTYSLTQDMNRFWYDEAGALNEAISDFMSLSFLAPSVQSPADPRVFSRWALGTFLTDYVGSRGAHRCSAYDSAYPNCSNFKSDESGFSATGNTLSYVYPDGVGWPYANNYRAPGYLRQAFLSYRGQEEIHNTGLVVTGALWEVYEAFKANHGGDASQAYGLTTRLVMETLRHLPKPTLANQSPVTFREFASQLEQSATLLGFSAQDQASVTQALTTRGLVGGTGVAADWAEVGAGKPETPGVKITDNSQQLKNWFLRMGTNPQVVTQSGGANNKFNPGEVAAIWFDVRNQSGNTAGGVTVTVTSEDPDITILDGNYNIGAISPSKAQIQYGKINGTEIVAALSSPNSTFHVPTGNSYFETNPHFDFLWTTAIFVKVNASATGGKSVNMRVELTPSNGVTETVTFPVTIH